MITIDLVGPVTLSASILRRWRTGTFQNEAIFPMRLLVVGCGLVLDCSYISQSEVQKLNSNKQHDTSSMHIYYTGTSKSINLKPHRLWEVRNGSCKTLPKLFPIIESNFTKQVVIKFSVKKVKVKSKFPNRLGG